MSKSNNRNLNQLGTHQCKEANKKTLTARLNATIGELRKGQKRELSNRYYPEKIRELSAVLERLNKGQTLAQNEARTLDKKLTGIRRHLSGKGKKVEQEEAIIAQDMERELAEIEV